MSETRRDLTICMPVYNEGDGIAEFLLEICSEFSEYQCEFVIINDCSSDDTVNVLENLSLDFPVNVYSNEVNLGHGPSTLKALQVGLNSRSNYVLSVDGDGQFQARDMLRLFEATLTADSNFGIGIRIRENELLYRRMVSFFTRCMIGFRTRAWIADANSPLRVYRRDQLRPIVACIDSLNPIPNLFISSYLLKGNYEFVQTKVVFRKRRGISSIGTTWGRTRQGIPSIKFVLFCFSSLIYWLRNSRRTFP
jgi:glycosyltransferase involved in cell wall biosynthesis